MSNDGNKRGPLEGLKIIELAGIGPGPLAGTLLADMGADVMRIDRNVPSGLGSPRTTRTDLLRRSRPSVAVDLKHPDAGAVIHRLLADAHVLVERRLIADHQDAVSVRVARGAGGGHSGFAVASSGPGAGRTPRSRAARR